MSDESSPDQLPERWHSQSIMGTILLTQKVITQQKSPPRQFMYSSANSHCCKHWWIFACVGAQGSWARHRCTGQSTSNGASKKPLAGDNVLRPDGWPPLRGGSDSYPVLGEARSRPILRRPTLGASGGNKSFNHPPQPWYSGLSGQQERSS
ncbi:hypothetical protein XU18_4007 [Perkinsela sp. CCAP 1560/4]|nr:hypothetical protein XU18_4007 [Perkinsela sp. CCAP 1560/4]|eukprot:KNH04819.1 hypothetical protein XU18_4007 [Perkinsela sp. CCAP 1560/4]